MRRLLLISLMLLPQVASAETADEVAARDAVTACMYFQGMNSVGFEFTVESTHKLVLDICKNQMAKYNVVMNPDKKLAYGGSGSGGPNYAKILLDLFLRDYGKALKVIKHD
jgi:hypothetical protein